MKSKQSVTMRDVGRELGVSAVTVSKALAGKEGVGEALRARIVAKAAALGYQLPAKQKASQPTHDVGVLIPDRFLSENSFYAQLYKLLVKRLAAAGCYGILEILSEADEADGRLPAMVRNGRVDALILLGQMSRDYLRAVNEVTLPVLFLDFYDEQSEQDAVVTDNLYGAYRLTSRLIRLGHTDIGFVGEWRATSSIMDRYLGYYKAMLSHELPIRPECVVQDRDPHGRDIPLSLPERLPTAFVCNCDECALRLMRTLQGMGLRVPEDVSVVGFDDYVIAKSSTPALSTFRVDQDSMAKAAVEMIVARLRGAPKQNGRTVIGGAPVYRNSEQAPMR